MRYLAAREVRKGSLAVAVGDCGGTMAAVAERCLAERCLTLMGRCPGVLSRGHSGGASSTVTVTEGPHRDTYSEGTLFSPLPRVLYPPPTTLPE